MAISDEAAALRRASKALSNAKQRCTNKKNPDYPNYGGAGIHVLIKTAKDLVAAIGLPANGYSLDRIDPNGHYEIGNVRWTTGEGVSLSVAYSAVIAMKLKARLPKLWNALA